MGEDWHYISAPQTTDYHHCKDVGPTRDQRRRHRHRPTRRLRTQDVRKVSFDLKRFIYILPVHRWLTIVLASAS